MDTENRTECNGITSALVVKYKCQTNQLFLIREGIFNGKNILQQTNRGRMYSGYYP